MMSRQMIAPGKRAGHKDKKDILKKRVSDLRIQMV